MNTNHLAITLLSELAVRVTVLTALVDPKKHKVAETREVTALLMSLG